MQGVLSRHLHYFNFFFGSLVRFVPAKSFSCFSLIDFAICLEAPLSIAFFVSPRLAESAAPAAICCFSICRHIQFVGRTKMVVIRRRASWGAAWPCQNGRLSATKAFWTIRKNGKIYPPGGGADRMPVARRTVNSLHMRVLALIAKTISTCDASRFRTIVMHRALLRDWRAVKKVAHLAGILVSDQKTGAAVAKRANLQAQVSRIEHLLGNPFKIPSEFLVRDCSISMIPRGLR